VTNVDQEMYSIYRNNHDLTFDDVAGSTGLGRLTRLMSGWGVKFFDYDNDGNVDLFIANGHPDDKIEAHSSHVMYKEPLLLFHNNGRGGLENVSPSAGPAFSQTFAARGMAVGDFNNDGALDVLVAVNGGAPVLLKKSAAGVIFLPTIRAKYWELASTQKSTSWKSDGRSPAAGWRLSRTCPSIDT
jgi:hypothetical protein